MTHVWRVYQRGFRYRVGKPMWWGMKWAKNYEWGDAHTYEVSVWKDAIERAQEENKYQEEIDAYRRDKWHEIS